MEQNLAPSPEVSQSTAQTQPYRKLPPGLALGWYCVAIGTLLTLVYWISGGEPAANSPGLIHGIAYGNPAFALGSFVTIAACCIALIPATRRWRANKGSNT